MCDEVGIVRKGDAIDGTVDFEEGCERVQSISLYVEVTVGSRGGSR